MEFKPVYRLIVDAVSKVIHATATAGRKLICTNIYVGTGYFRFVAVALDPTRRK